MLGRAFNCLQIVTSYKCFLPALFLSSAPICPPLCGLWHRVSALGLPRSFRKMSTALQKHLREKCDSFPSKWRCDSPSSAIYHVIGIFGFVGVELVCHQICLCRVVSGSGFCSFGGRACTAVFWCVHAQPWPLASWRAMDGGVEVRAPRRRLLSIGSARGEWRKTTRSKSPGRARGGCCSFLQAPRLSDGLEGASGSDLYVGKRGGPKPSFLWQSWARILMQITPQRYTLK